MCLLLGKRRRVPFAAVWSQPGVVCSEKVTFDPLTCWPFQKRTPQGQFRGPATYTHQVWRRSFKGPWRSRGTNKQTDRQTNAARSIVWWWWYVIYSFSHNKISSIWSHEFIYQLSTNGCHNITMSKHIHINGDLFYIWLIYSRLTWLDWSNEIATYHHMICTFPTC